jgi:hypothetical protein
VGVVGPGPVVETLVALLEHGPHGAPVGPPGGVIVDQGRGLLRPDEDLQRTGAVPGFVAARQVPVLGPPRLLEEGIDARVQESGVPR